MTWIATAQSAAAGAPVGGKAIEIASGVWTLLMDLSLGAVPPLLVIRGAS